MNLSRKTLVTTLLLLAIFFGGALASYGVPATATFTGKIQDIRQATDLGLGKRETSYAIKLDSEPKPEFRLSIDEAVHYGVVDAGGPTMVVTPKMKKGLGWKVRLTCDNAPTGPVSAPVYRVKSLERLDN